VLAKFEELFDARHKILICRKGPLGPLEVQEFVQPKQPNGENAFMGAFACLP
jgi:hypothetical protein